MSEFCPNCGSPVEPDGAGGEKANMGMRLNVVNGRAQWLIGERKIEKSRWEKDEATGRMISIPGEIHPYQFRWEDAEVQLSDKK